MKDREKPVQLPLPALEIAVAMRGGAGDKRRNMLGHLPDEHRPFIEQTLTAAWAMRSNDKAKKALQKVQAELQRINPSAARSCGGSR